MSMLRDTTTVALGLRAHIKLSDTMWLRPGVAFVHAGLDDPMSDSKYKIVQLDIPFVVLNARTRSVSDQDTHTKHSAR